MHVLLTQENLTSHLSSHRIELLCVCMRLFGFGCSEFHPCLAFAPNILLRFLMRDSGADGILPAYPTVKNLLQFSDQASQIEEGGS